MEAATIRSATEHEAQDVSQLHFQGSLVAEAVHPRALSGISM